MIILYNPRAAESKARLPISVLSLAAVFEGRYKWRLVDGNVVRCTYKTDYTEGGHGQVYPWVPKREIWVEKALDRTEGSSR